MNMRAWVRRLVPVAAIVGAAALGGCVAYPASPYGYYGGYYGGGYTYAYAPPTVGFWFGGDRGWRYRHRYWR